MSRPRHLEKAPALAVAAAGRPSRQEGSSVGSERQRADNRRPSALDRERRAREREAERREKRWLRWRLRNRVQAMTSMLADEGMAPVLPSAWACGRYIQQQGGTPGNGPVRLDAAGNATRTKVGGGGYGQAVLMLGPDGRASWDGLQTCSSVSACPVCSARIRGQRTREIEAAGIGWLRKGHHLGFGTLTLPHDQGERLVDTLGAVKSAWRAVQQDKAFRAVKKSYGLRFIRSVEITHTRDSQGGNGWHPHLHVLWFSEVELTETRLAALDAAVRSAWVAHVVGTLKRREPTQLDLQAVEGRTDKKGLLRYLTKVQDGYERATSVAMEMVRGDLKTGRRALSRVPFEIAEGAAAGSVLDRDLWREYEAATKGLRVVDKSKHLYADLGVAELVDELCPDDGAGPGAVPLLHLDPVQLPALQPYLVHLLDKAELGGREMVEAYLQRLHTKLRPGEDSRQ